MSLVKTVVENSTVSANVDRSALALFVLLYRQQSIYMLDSSERPGWLTRHEFLSIWKTIDISLQQNHLPITLWTGNKTVWQTESLFGTSGSPQTTSENAQC